MAYTWWLFKLKKKNKVIKIKGKYGKILHQTHKKGELTIQQISHSKFTELDATLRSQSLKNQYWNKLTSLWYSFPSIKLVNSSF